MTTRTVQTDLDLEALVALLKTRPRPYTVNITKGIHRTTDQNRLQWLWLNEIAEQLGDRTAEEIRAECKLRFGVPILRAENEAFRDKYDRIVKPLPYEAKIELMGEPIDFPVTRLMTTKQLTQYLDAIYAHYTAQGCRLTIPEPAA